MVSGGPDSESLLWNIVPLMAKSPFSGGICGEMHCWIKVNSSFDSRCDLQISTPVYRCDAYLHTWHVAGNVNRMLRKCLRLFIKVEPYIQDAPAQSSRVQQGAPTRSCRPLMMDQVGDECFFVLSQCYTYATTRKHTHSQAKSQYRTVRHWLREDQADVDNVLDELRTRNGKASSIVRTCCKI